MIKTGIYDLDQVIGRSRFSTLFGKDKIVSITLYDQIRHMPNADRLAERILLHFTDERSTYKCTYAKRFPDFDDSVLQLMRKRFPPHAPLLVKDLAVSDGRTACDFFERIAAEFPRVSYQASDYGPRVFVIERGRARIALSRNHRVVEVVWPPFVLRNMQRENPLFYPVNFVLRLLLSRFLVAPLLDDYASGKLQARELLLVAPRTLTLAATEERFQLGEHDLLTPFPEAEEADVIRAMNVLNPGYFGSDDVKTIIGHIHRGLSPQGWFLTGLNQAPGSLVHGSVYEKTRTGFTKVWGSGDGSPVESQILPWSTT